MSDRSKRRPHRTPNSKWATWWAGLAPGPKAGMIISGLLLAPALCCAGALAAVASTDPRNPESDVPTTPIVVTSPAKPPERPPTPASTAASTPPPSSAAPPPAPSTRVDVRIVTVDEVMPYVERTIDDPSRPAGQRTVTKQGKPGKKARTFEVTYTDGRETGRRLVRETVVTPPTDHVISVGSAVVPRPTIPVRAVATPTTAAASLSPATWTARAEAATDRRMSTDRST